MFAPGLEEAAFAPAPVPGGAAGSEGAAPGGRRRLRQVRAASARVPPQECQECAALLACLHELRPTRAVASISACLPFAGLTPATPGIASHQPARGPGPCGTRGQHSYRVTLGKCLAPMCSAVHSVLSFGLGHVNVRHTGMGAGGRAQAGSRASGRRQQAVPAGRLRRSISALLLLRCAPALPEGPCGAPALQEGSCGAPAPEGSSGGATPCRQSGHAGWLGAAPPAG